MISHATINALAGIGDCTTARSCLDMLDRGIAKLEKLEQARAKAREEMRSAIRKTPPKLNPPKPVSAKLKNTGDRTPSRKGGLYGRDLSVAELDHAERMVGEGYALSKIAHILDTTQSSIERGIRARKGAA